MLIFGCSVLYNVPKKNGFIQKGMLPIVERHQIVVDVYIQNLNFLLLLAILPAADVLFQPIWFFKKLVLWEARASAAGLAHFQLWRRHELGFSICGCGPSFKGSLMAFNVVFAGV